MDAVKWMVQYNLISFSQINPLLDALKKNDIAYETFPVVPFEDEFQLPEAFANEEKLIPYGSTSLMNRIMKLEKWPLGFVFCPLGMKPSVWNLNRMDMLNQDGITMTVEEAYNSLPEGTWFIRPNSDLKAFSGEVIHSDEFRIWIDRLSSGEYLFDGSLELFIATPKTIIGAEYRVFIVDRKVITMSSYGKGTTKVNMDTYLDTPQYKDVYRLAEEFWLPEECVVLDFTTIGGKRKIIEFNCINASGFYAHDIEKFALAMTNYVGCCSTEEGSEN